VSSGAGRSLLGVCGPLWRLCDSFTLAIGALILKESREQPT